ncbi:hypothetical protein V5O48_008158 [Marasmius crinis-equi]|uniref:Uncharacterized protein n=1 Tax=Marasmius crinis-equi TaxID=585013 RepID=A0ABR3FF10_9AGAR
MKVEVAKKMRPRDRIMFKATSKKSREQVESANRELYQINHYLSNFFHDNDDVTRFRSVQTITQAIIGGSSAYEFFESKSKPGILKIYVVGWRSGALLYFIPTTGYSLSDYSPPHKLESISRVDVFTCPGRPDIHVHLTSFGILLPILEQPFSCYMALLSSTQAIHLFPNSCLQHREAVENQNGGEDEPYPALAKRIRDDGYIIYRQVTDRERYRGLKRSNWTFKDAHFSEFRLRRRVGDNRTLVMELGNEGLTHLSARISRMKSLLAKNSWAFDQEHGPLPPLSSHQSYQPPFLEWQYVVRHFCQSLDILVQHGMTYYDGCQVCIEYNDRDEQQLSLEVPNATCTEGHDSANEGGFGENINYMSSESLDGEEGSEEEGSEGSEEEGSEGSEEEVSSGDE